jgi:hypothetical protein
VDELLKEVGHAALLEGDRLLINDSLLFTLSTAPGEKNLRLLKQTAHFANGYTFATSAGTPSFRHIVSGFFAKAASCKITGHHSIGQGRQIDYTTPDAPSLLKLKRIFLHEKALFRHGKDPDQKIDPDKATDAATSSSNGNSHYKFTWLDAQGAPLAYAELVDRELIGLNGDSYFSTNSRGINGADISLWLRVTRLVDPESFTPPSADPPPPDYRAMIQDLFSKAASCRIEGRYAPEGVSIPYYPDFTAADADALQILKEIFLFEKPRYDGRTDGEDTSAESPERLQFTWKDAQGKELGRVSLLDGDKLEFRTTHDLFRTSEEKFGAANSTLYTRAARFALPRYFGKPALPDYQNLVQGLFAKAAICRIKGYYTDVEADATHDVDFTAPDAPALLALKNTFLAEKPDYAGIDNRADLGGTGSSCLHFFWTDAQGKELGHVALLHEDKLFFFATQDVFTASSGPEKRFNSRLLTQMAHLALPEVYGKRKPSESGGAVKKDER